MPLTFFVGDFGDEQGVGSTLDNGLMDVYIAKSDNPTELFYMGGHRFDDAPSYNLSETKIVNRYVVDGGRNKVVEQPISTEYALSTTLNMMLPNFSLALAERFYQQQNVCEFDILFVPRNCGVGCESYFYLGRNIKLGVTQITSSLTGFGENEGGITRMKTVRVQGNLETYLGLETNILSDGDSAVTAIEVVEEACEACGCPYQTMVRGVVGEAAAPPVVEYTEDGGASWTGLTTTAITADHFVTDIIYSNGRTLVAHADVDGGTATAGGVAWVDGYTGTLVASTFSSAPAGIQSLEAVGNKIYAFGTGEAWFSCDGGLTFEALTVPFTETVVDTAYDGSDIYLALTTGLAYQMSRNENFVEITSQISPTAATDLTAVATYDDGVIFGGANGNIYESFDNLATWKTSSVGSGSVNGIATDGDGYRVLVSEGSNVRVREATRQQNFELLTTLGGAVNQLYAGKKLLDEGTNWFVGVSEAGETFTVATCGICFESGC